MTLWHFAEDGILCVRDFQGTAELAGICGIFTVQHRGILRNLCYFLCTELQCYGSGSGLDRYLMGSVDPFLAKMAGSGPGFYKSGSETPLCCGPDM